MSVRTETTDGQRADILYKAMECVCGQREQDYGSPEDNFKLIADFWNVYLSFNGDFPTLGPKDVAMMMALLKVARIKSGTGTEDSFVDLAGYAACAGEIATRTEAACVKVDLESITDVTK